MNRLTPRERFLLAVVISALFVFGNGMLLKWISSRNTGLQADLAAKRVEVKSMKALLAGSDLWAARDAWLTAHQPKLTNPQQAGVRLLDQVKETARACDVTLESPLLGSVEPQPSCRSVSVQVATKSSWENLVKFLHAMQQPDLFIVFETTTLQIDPGNASRMACQFKIAKCYAP